MLKMGDSAKVVIKQDMKGRRHKYGFPCLAPFVFASHEYESFHLLMPLYLIRRWDGQPQAKEHKALAWVKPMKLDDYPMPPADGPLVAWLRDLI